MIAVFEDGGYVRGMVDRLRELEARQDELNERVSAAPADLPDIHPNISDVYRRKVARLAEALESGRKRIVYFHSLASLRMKSWMLATKSHARALSMVASKSFARRRLCPNHAKVRPTTQRRGSTTNPSALSSRLTISTAQSPIFFSASASFGPA